MKYLKKYRLFEELPWDAYGKYHHEEDSVQKRVADNIKYVESMKQTIKDILLPISDMGYKNISITDNTTDSGPFYKSPTELIIRVVSYTDKPLIIDELVKDEFDRLVDYLNSQGFDNISVNYVDKSPQISKRYDDFIDNISNGYSVKNLLFIARHKNYIRLT
jgi:hypothetical protein